MRYWHFFGREIPEGEFLAGCWQTILVGPVDHAVPRGEECAGVPWLHTWSHYPTPQERDTLAPQEFRE